VNGRVVLDAAGLEQLTSTRPTDHFRALLAVARERGRAVVVPAAVCAELCRGVPRTRAVEAALGRHSRERGRRPAVTVVDLDLRLAKQVGAIMYAAGAASGDLVDASVIAVAVAGGGGLVVTADPDDIERLAAVVPAVRIITTRAA
jgi:predicted nucleic acid-binding protein